MIQLCYNVQITAAKLQSLLDHFHFKVQLMINGTLLKSAASIPPPIACLAILRSLFLGCLSDPLNGMRDL